MLPQKKQIKQKSYYKTPSPIHTPFQIIQNNTSTYMHRQFNTRTITVWVSQNIFYIEPKQNTSAIPTVLKINRKQQSITQLTMQQYKFDKYKQEKIRKQVMQQRQQKYQPMQALYFSLFIGIINLSQSNNIIIPTIHNPQSSTKSSKYQPQQNQNKKVLVLAQTVQLVCTINLRNIYKILKPIFLFYNPKHKQNINENQAMLLLNLGYIFQQGMYYSYTYNLTQSLQSIQACDKIYVESQDKLDKILDKNKQQQNNTTKDQGIYRDKDKQKDIQQKQQRRQFNWAQKLQQQLLNCNKNWSIPIIQGFINKIQVYVNAQKFKIVLISRRNRQNGGPLQFSTGFTKNNIYNINQQNKCYKNVGNYVQTQLIFHVKNLYFSFLQVRGTVPLYWQYKYNYGIPIGIIFKQSIQQNYKDFLQHIEYIKKSNNYQHVLLLNLLQKNIINTQRKLIQNYQYIIHKCQKQPGIHYTYFDIHQRCPNKNYKQFTYFLNTQLKQLLLHYSFNVLEHRQFLKLQKIVQQKGIIRINCGTCIDRTNLVQSKIAAWQIVQILKYLNIRINNIDQNLEFIQDDSPFAKLYRNLWADNGDAISQQYAGTLSMESSTLRAGKISYMATIDHGLTSLLRAARNVVSEDLGKSRAVLFLSSKCQNNSKNKYTKKLSIKKQQNNNSNSKINLIQ